MNKMDATGLNAIRLPKRSITILKDTVSVKTPVESMSLSLDLPDHRRQNNDGHLSHRGNQPGR